MEPQNLIDNAVQVRKRLQFAKVLQINAFQFLSQLRNLRWVPGEIVEDVDEGERHGIAPGDDQCDRVPVQGVQIFLQAVVFGGPADEVAGNLS